MRDQRRAGIITPTKRAERRKRIREAEEHSQQLAHDRLALEAASARLDRQMNRALSETLLEIMSGVRATPSSEEGR